MYNGGTGERGWGRGLRKIKRDRYAEARRLKNPSALAKKMARTYGEPYYTRLGQREMEAALIALELLGRKERV